MGWPGIFWIFVLLLEWLLALGWVARLVAWRRHAPRVTDLWSGDFAPLLTEYDGPPQLSVIVPACNEEAAIEATLRSLLASEGVRLQIVAVNDRSTDRTGEIMRRVAAEWAAGSDDAARKIKRIPEHLLEVVDIEELPGGWLGKPHALFSGVRRVRAQWLLFTDGDVVFHPQAAGRALACAVERQAGQLVLLPDLVLGSRGEAAMHGMMYSLSLWGFEPWNVENPKSSDFLGVGAFNLMHRSSYDAVGGMEGLRLEVLEDMRMGWKIKRAGLQPMAVFGPGLVRVRWAHGAWGVVRNTEKNLFSLYRFRVWLTVLASFALSLHVLVPTVVLAGGVISDSRIFRGVAFLGLTVHAAALVGLYRETRRITHVPTAYVLLFPLAMGLFVFAHLRSMMLALVRGGIRWRGSFYSLRTLREHAGKWR